MTYRLLAPLLAALGLLLLPPAAGHVHAEETHDTLRDFARTGRYMLYVNADKQDEARIYHSRRAGAFLVLDSDFGKPFLIQPREGTVSSLAKEEVVNLTAKRADVAKDATPQTLGGFRVEGRDILISVPGLVARLKPQPYALGRLTAEELLIHTPDYERDAERYRLSEGEIQRLKACGADAEIVIYFGTWCPTCKRLIPRILRVEQELADTKVDIVYYGLPKGSAFHDEPTVKKYDIRAVPTAIVFRDGKAVGRIDGKSLAEPEDVLCTGG